MQEIVAVIFGIDESSLKYVFVARFLKVCFLKDKAKDKAKA